MSDLEKIVSKEQKPSKLKSFISAIGLTVLIMLGKWEAAAQTSANRDQILNQIEQTLNNSGIPEYNKLLEQRNNLLKSYETDWDIFEKFVSTQKRDFENSYTKNEFWIQNEIKTISVILENDFGVNVKWKTPVQILSIALQIISNEDSMTGMKWLTENLSGEFDLAFMNAYGYIQAKNPNTWVKVWNTVMPNWELDGLIWERTVMCMTKLLNDWTYTADFGGISFGDGFVPNKPNNNNWGDVVTSNNHSTVTSNNDATNSNNTQIDDNSSTIDLDDVDDEDIPEPEINTNNNAINNDSLNPIDQDDGNNDWLNNDDDGNNQGGNDNIQENNNDNEINLDDYSFNDEVANIVESMNWDSDILSQHLDKSKLVDVSYQDIINTVNWFSNNNLKKTVMYYLLSNDVIHAQEIMWMSMDCDSRYPGFLAKDKLGKNELKNMKELWKIRRFDSPDEVLSNWNIPQKVKEVFSNILEWKIKTNWKPYSIVSKDDYRIYMFSWDNHLLSRQPVLVWADQWDQKNNVKQWVQTTPGGAYRVGQRYENYLWKDFFVNYGSHYIILVPEDGQYDLTNQYSMWVHGDYKWDRNRKTDLYSTNSKDHRTTNGCINVDSDLFWEIYNHLELWALIYVTPESQ